MDDLRSLRPGRSRANGSLVPVRLAVRMGGRRRGARARTADAPPADVRTDVRNRRSGGTIPACPTSVSSPRSSPPATSRRRSKSSSTGSRAASATRRSWASPAAARRSRWPRRSQRHQKPTLVLAHNKTLAAQLYAEFREFFPDNAVEYFVSYFDYYQPEAYLPRSDTYIEKDSSRNEEIDRLRHAATHALFERRDVIIVASVSCIYGLGAPVDYGATVLKLRVGGHYRRDAVLRHLVDLQYQRNDAALTRARFRVRGDTLEIGPASSEIIVRVEFFGDEVERITELDPLTGELLAERKELSVFPATHFVTPRDKLGLAIQSIEAEMEERLGADGVGGPGARGGAAPPADDVRPRDAPRARLLLGRRELLAPPEPARAGQPAVDAARLLPARLAADRRRVAHDDPAGRRHVQERPDAEGDPRRLRVPAAVRAGQPAADVRGVREARQPDDLRLGDARAVRAREERAHRRAAHPPDRHRRPADHRPPHREPDRRPPGGDPGPGREGRAGARHDADQEDGRGPRRLPQGARHQGPVPPQRGRHAGAGRDPARPAARRVRRAGRASTSSARASTCPR